MIVLDIFDDKCTVIIIRRKKTDTIMCVKYVCILFVAMLIFEINYMSASDQHIKLLLFTELHGPTNRGVHVSFINGNIYDSFGHL